MPDSAQRRRLWYERAVLLAGLAAMLAAMLATHGALSLHGAGLRVAIALAVASVCWLTWVLAGPRGDTTTLRVLTACTAVSGSVLLLLYPSLAVYWFTFWGCFNAGVSFPTRVGAAITGGSAAILVAGWLAQRGSILSAFAAVAFVGYVFGRNRRKYIGLASQATATADERERDAARAERERIARELHDVLGHSLTSVSMQIESAAAVLETTHDADGALSPGLDGVAATQQVAQAHPEIAVVVLTSHADDDTIQDALAAGARGFLTKSAGRAQLAQAIHAAAAGLSPMDVQVQARLLSAARLGRVPAELPDGLTRREAEVLALIGAGLTNAQIAGRMHVSTATVKTHVNRIFAKTGAADRAAAIRYARDQDLSPFLP